MDSHQKAIIDQFTLQAAPFAKSPGHTNEESLHLLVEMSEVSGNDIVLDVACGAGMVACAFATVARRVTGIDLTPAMLEQARLLAERKGLSNLSWHEGATEAMPFADESFSVVVSRYAFHHFPDPAAVLSEMVRVCRSGGRVLIADGCPPPEKAEAYNHFERLFDPSHVRALTLDELRRLMIEAGLQNIRERFYRMEMNLEQQLASMFPNPGDDDELRRLFREDVGVDRLGVGAHLRGEAVHFAYPVVAIAGEKAG